MKPIKAGVVALAFASSTVAEAAGPVYFDLGTGLAILVGYIIGLIGLLVVLSRGASSTKRKVALVLACYVVGPPGFLALEKGMSQLRADEAAIGREIARQEAHERLLALCKLRGDAKSLRAGSIKTLKAAVCLRDRLLSAGQEWT